MHSENSSAAVGALGIVRAGESTTGEPLRFIGKETFIKLAAGNGAAPSPSLKT